MQSWSHWNECLHNGGLSLSRKKKKKDRFLKYFRAIYNFLQGECCVFLFTTEYRLLSPIMGIIENKIKYSKSGYSGLFQFVLFHPCFFSPFFFYFIFILPEENQKAPPTPHPSGCFLLPLPQPGFQVSSVSLPLRMLPQSCLCSATPISGLVYGPGYPHIPLPFVWGAAVLPCTILQQLGALVPSSSSTD